MLNRNALVLATLLVVGAVCCQLVAAVELVEMNDANRNELRLELSKSLAGVQEAYKNGFKFTEVRQVRKFLDQCDYVNQVISGSDDSAFKGLAGKIRAVMAEPSITEACSVTRDELSADFDELDTGFKASNQDYLSLKVCNKLVQLNEQANANDRLKTVLKHVIDLKVDELTEALLNSASTDVDQYLGEESEPNGLFDFETRHKRLCEVSLVAPICMLVRRSSRNVSVVAHDFEDFGELVQKNDDGKLNQHTSLSGITLGVVKANCAKMMGKMKSFKPIDLMWSYVSAGLLDRQRVEQRMEEDETLASYNALYDLCNVIKSLPVRQ